MAKSKLKGKSRPKARPQARPATAPATAPATQPQVAPPAPAPAPALSFYERAQRLGDSFGGGGHRLGSNAVQGPWGFIEGAGSALVGGRKFGGILAQGAVGALAYKGLKPLGERLLESDKAKETRVKTENQTKYEDKVTTAIMGNRTNGFSLDDLDDADKNQDAGWRESIESMDNKEFSKLAADSIKNDNANAIWNAVITKAQRSGKKVNASKPLFLPNTFTKEGKNYSYAIHYDKEARQAKFVPIEIGGQPFGREVKE